MNANASTSTTVKSIFLFLLWLGLVGLSGCSSSSNSPAAALPKVSLSAASVTEGNSGTSNLEFTVNSSEATDSVVTLTYSTSDGTATAGTDYTETSGNVDIPAGSTSVTITVPVTGDTDIEADETLTLTLTAATGATLGTATATGTILNDDEDPKGFYDSGSATVKQNDNMTDRAISDLQGMVSGNRFMLLSVNEVLLYDGTITSMGGNSYTATVDIYEDGVLLDSSVPATGSITTASTLTGTLTGTGAGNGSFSLTYSLNNAASVLSRIDRVDGWNGPLNGAPNDVRTTYISDTGLLSMTGPHIGSTPVISDCTVNAGSTVLPVAGVNVYEVTVTLSTCGDPMVNGDYTGFATTQSVADDLLILTYSNGSYSASGTLIQD